MCCRLAPPPYTPSRPPRRAQVFLLLIAYLFVAREGVLRHVGTSGWYFLILIFAVCFLPDIGIDSLPPPPSPSDEYWSTFIAEFVSPPPPPPYRIEPDTTSPIAWQPTA